MKDTPVPSPVTNSEPLTSSDWNTLAALSRSIQRASGFTLLFAVCNTPVKRDAIIRRLRERFPDSQPVAVLEDTHDVLALIAGQVADAFLVSGLEVGIVSEIRQHARLVALNQRREEWRELAIAPVVLFVPQYLLAPLARSAPDFLDWRIGTFSFEPISTPIPNALRSDFVIEDTWKLDKEERTARVTHLTRLIDQNRQTKDQKVLAKWILELTDHQLAFHEYEAAAGLLATELLPIINVEGMDYFRAEWLDRSGNINVVAGNLDDAWGQFTEAHAIFKKLGEEQDAAVTMGKIADILQSRGDLDEALRIRREEELPVYKKLGDVHSLLVGRANLAISLLQQDAVSHRNEARTLLILALEAAEQLRIPEAGQIGQILASIEDSE